MMDTRVKAVCHAIDVTAFDERRHVSLAPDDPIAATDFVLAYRVQPELAGTVQRADASGLPAVPSCLLTLGDVVAQGSTQPTPAATVSSQRP